MSQTGMTQDDYAFSKMTQYNLVAGCFQSDKLMKFSADLVRHEDFSMPICQIIWEALYLFWRDYGCRPSEPDLSMTIFDIMNDNTGKYKSMVTPEEREGLANLLHMVYTQPPINVENMMSKLPECVNRSRMERIEPGNTTGRLMRGRSIASRGM